MSDANLHYKTVHLPRLAEYNYDQTAYMNNYYKYTNKDDYITISRGYMAAWLVEALHYKLEDQGFATNEITGFFQFT
jgi:hypothetical protein